jgi:hypothetical protein
LELWLCYKNFNAGAKKPNADGGEHNILAFPKITKRAKKPALAINYAIGANRSNGLGDFLLTEKKSPKVVKDTIEIGRADPLTGKMVDSDHFGIFFGTEETANGIPLTRMMDGKVTRTVYFIRTAPTENENADGTFSYTAASKPKKITARGVGKPTKRKIDYKKEIIKLKKGDSYAFGASMDFIEVTAAKGVLLEEIVHDYITDNKAVKIKRAATAKKPATTIQVIQPISRAVLLPIDSENLLTNGRLVLDNAYEVRRLGTEKWGKLPKISAAGVHLFDIRIKSTAKVSAAGSTGEAASLIGTLRIEAGANGITAAITYP